ncbi:MAG: hypothetical protein EBY44_04425 [Actinobacteria bacterium]|nr:hypothetical protein [Actinomycetota bacterium]
MIDDFYNEDEQWQRVKRWLRENGPWMVAGVVIGLGALYGWRWWEARAQDQAIAASDAYQAVIVRLEGNDLLSKRIFWRHGLKSTEVTLVKLQRA